VQKPNLDFHVQLLIILVESAESVEWWLNGEKLTTNSAKSLFWYLHPGKWSLEVKSGDMTDRVTFQVEVARTKPTRRGFSVVNSHRPSDR
jgi:penicillin-binding protein 1C